MCGVDEAGRGPWAGPVYAAAVILKDRGRHRRPQRFQAAHRRRSARRWRSRSRRGRWPGRSAFATVEEIAALNIFHATGLAMRRAVEALAHAPAFALVDGNHIFPLPCPARAVVKGDCLSASIAAASILAKTARDRVMVAMDADYPGYGFAAHKGYGAPTHVEALRALRPLADPPPCLGPGPAAIAGTLEPRPARRSAAVAMRG